MQIELLGAQRRVQARVPLPSATFDRRKPDHKQCRPVLQFKDIPIDWSDFRLMIRQTADILRRFETLELADYDRIQGLARDGQIEAVVATWYEAAMAPARRTTDARSPRARAARSGAAAGDAPVPGALRRGAVAEAGAERLAPALLPALRRRAGVCVHQSRRRASADLRPVHRTVAVRPDHVPVLREQRPQRASRHSRAATAGIASTRATSAIAT